MRAPLVVLVLLVAGCADMAGSPAPTVATVVDPPPARRLELVEVLAGLTHPILYLPVPGSDDMLVVEQGGPAWLVREGKLVQPAFLDLTDRIQAGGEQGFLGFAFPPDLAESGVAYASFTDRDGDDIVARYTLAQGTRDRLDRATEEVLFDIDDPYGNHNGGHIAFYDGHLWYGTGDGGGGGDPQENGQDPHALLGSLLRVDVGSAGPYEIPADNPFAQGGGAPEVWAKGLRNPWRFSFDAATGDLWIADVGQNAWEEVDKVSTAQTGVVNFGWNVYEGTHPYDRLGRAPFSEVTMPVAEYENGDGECAVTGGHVYRGSASPAWQGVYLFGDYCSGKIRSLTMTPQGYAMTVELDSDAQIASFAEDASGELYVVDHGGAILRLQLA